MKLSTLQYKIRATEYSLVRFSILFFIYFGKILIITIVERGFVHQADGYKFMGHHIEDDSVVYLIYQIIIFKTIFDNSQI